MQRSIAIAWLSLFVLVGSVCEAAGPITPSPFWKNTLDYPNDLFRVLAGELVEEAGANPAWIKFTILTCDPTTVYYQDSREFPFHYDFATTHLDPFVGMSAHTYNQISLFEVGQQAILGAVFIPESFAGARPAEYAIQLVRQDEYTAQETLDILNVVAASVPSPSETKVLYFPTFEQQGVAETNADFLASNGFEVSGPDRWLRDSAVYSQGWALGTLRFVTASGIDAAYRNGTLRPEDILLTDGVPAEIPFVAGILSLAPATPSSHVAILAQSYGVPFAHVSDETDVAAVQDLVDNKVALRVYDDYFLPNVRIINVEGQLDNATIAEILELKELPELAVTPMAPHTDFSVPVAGLQLSDIQYVGGKAANYSLLLDAIPASSRVAMAFTFNLWNAFMDQTVAGGSSLRDEVRARLAGVTYPPPNVAELEATLTGIRALFTNSTSTQFSATLEDAVLAALQDPRYSFDPNKKIRLRSSTNVEDSEFFVGAGLYISRSGCLADELDGDDVGPSACDVDRNDEQSVFSAIRRVFASFYNLNAYLERLRWGVNEDEVGMGLLVHHSFPDEIELANGVATVSKAFSFYDVDLVTQVGAVSVSNPSDGSIPEEVEVRIRPHTTWPLLIRPSYLTLLGETVLEWESEYATLAGLLVDVAKMFETRTGKTSGYVLDFEFKKIDPGGTLIVKQVREIPRPDTTRTITPFLINEPLEYTTFQGEYGNVFGNHRLKARWLFETRNMWMTIENLSMGLFDRVRMEYRDETIFHEADELLPSYPEFSHEFIDEQFRKDSFSRWTFDHLSNGRRYELGALQLKVLVAPSESPLLTQLDFEFRYARVDYDRPVLTWNDFPAGTVFDSTEFIQIAPASPEEEQPGELPQTRSFFDGATGVNIETSFHWPPDPGAFAGYTAPLVRWIETRIEGLTTEPIVLNDWWAQSYRPEHHNFSEHLLFEPHLDPGVPAETIAELDDLNIQLIYFLTGPPVGGQGSRIEFFSACLPYIRGDVDADNAVDVIDALYLLFYLFAGGLELAVPEAGDINGNGATDIGDAVYLLTYLYLRGPVPPEPFPTHGCDSGDAEVADTGG